MDLIYSFYISPGWLQTYSLGTIPNLSWPSFLQSTFSVISDFPSVGDDLWLTFVNPCIIWLSWDKWFMLCYWFCPVLEVFCTQLFNWALFMCSHSVAPMSLITFFCDMFPLLKLICTDSYVIGILVANGGMMCIILFLL